MASPISTCPRHLIGSGEPSTRLPTGRRPNRGMTMYSFDYFRPSSLSEVEGLLTANGDAVPLAGGQTLIPSLKQRLANPRWVIDLKGIGGLVGIERSGDTL